MPIELADSPATEATGLLDVFCTVRRATEDLCQPLATDDYLLQSMPEASPVKWHLAHTTWFFETFLLIPHLPSYQPYQSEFGVLFNSYYQTVGDRYPRPQRHLLSRPTVAEVYRYRAHVDASMTRFLEAGLPAGLADTLVLGINHEQQHQELILTDLKAAWAANPLHPVYRAALPSNGGPEPAAWLPYSEGVAWIGHDGPGFTFDNETPRHRVFLHAFQLGRRLVTNAEYQAFIADGGYQRPELWLSDGWAVCQARGWTAPLYWEQHDNRMMVVTLAGLQPLVADEPVCHVSYYEADAFARWTGARLPTEAEWETAAAGVPLAGHFVESGRYHPAPAPAATDVGPLFQLQGEVWQWTASPYTAYPGYQPAAGALGEYNGKFMINQMVLRGSSCVTPRSHARLTYRNFFPPDARWQFSGIRLAR